LAPSTNVLCNSFIEELRHYLEADRGEYILFNSPNDGLQFLKWNSKLNAPAGTV
jgi:hypothetical protein